MASFIKDNNSQSNVPSKFERPKLKVLNKYVEVKKHRELDEAEEAQLEREEVIRSMVNYCFSQINLQGEVKMLNNLALLTLSNGFNDEQSHISIVNTWIHLHEENGNKLGVSVKKEKRALFQSAISHYSHYSHIICR